MKTFTKRHRATEMHRKRLLVSRMVDPPGRTLSTSEDVKHMGCHRCKGGGVGMQFGSFYMSRSRRRARGTAQRQSSHLVCTRL